MMKNIECENCVYFCEPKDEQPCCGCVDNFCFVKLKVDKERMKEYVDHLRNYKHNKKGGGE